MRFIISSIYMSDYVAPFILKMCTNSSGLEGCDIWGT